MAILEDRHDYKIRKRAGVVNNSSERSIRTQATSIAFLNHSHKHSNYRIWGSLQETEQLSVEAFVHQEFTFLQNFKERSSELSFSITHASALRQFQAVHNFISKFEPDYSKCEFTSDESLFFTVLKGSLKFYIDFYFTESLEDGDNEQVIISGYLGDEAIKGVAGPMEICFRKFRETISEIYSSFELAY